ncbi:hypothetical protein [Hymenobacter sp. 102]|uniref:hypothetical protein n=1 Tax=Hymenobacter sp. 102 TaxID=3403152 RepID=UPI003CFB4B74
MISAQFTVFSQHGRFGLLCNGQELLAPEYDAVWPLGHGFYGFRQERRYGILAPDGRIVLPVCVPACFAGYRMLDMGQQLAYASQGSQRGPRDLQRDFPGLRLHQDIPYHPTDWWAEQALADLWELNSPGRESLLLPVRSRQLALHSNGTWSWEDPEADADQLVLCGTGEAGGFSWRNQQSELLPPDTEQLLRWQARCQQVLASLQKESDSPVQPVQPAAPDAWQEADYHERALDAVLKQAGIRGLFMVDDLDFADYVPYDEDELSRRCALLATSTWVSTLCWMRPAGRPPPSCCSWPGSVPTAAWRWTTPQAGPWWMSVTTVAATSTPCCWRKPRRWPCIPTTACTS